MSKKVVPRHQRSPKCTERCWYCTDGTVRGISGASKVTSCARFSATLQELAVFVYRFCDGKLLSGGPFSETNAKISAFLHNVSRAKQPGKACPVCNSLTQAYSRTGFRFRGKVNHAGIRPRSGVDTTGSTSGRAMPTTDKCGPRWNDLLPLQAPLFVALACDIDWRTSRSRVSDASDQTRKGCG